MDGGSENDDVDPNPYVQGQCTAGFFVPFQVTQSFLPARPEVNDDVFLELESGLCTVCSSEMGLVLCRHPHLGPFRYSVCNPFHNGSKRIIPKPDRTHPDSAPRVLVVRWDPCRLCLVFHIVCAVPVDDDQHTRSYTFDVYSSNTDKWESIVKTTCIHGEIRENTGVSCGTRAYWLLDNPPMLAHYDVESRRAATSAIYLPNLRQPSYLLHTQLGRCGTRLCLAVSLTNKFKIEVYTMGNGDSWCLCCQETYEGPERPTLSRFQSARLLQVPLWFKETFDMMKIALDAESEVQTDSWEFNEQPDSYESMVPHVHSNWLPRLHFPLFP